VNRETELNAPTRAGSSDLLGIVIFPTIPSPGKLRQYLLDKWSNRDALVGFACSALKLI